jgi:flagellar biogenesis protein FliO
MNGLLARAKTGREGLTRRSTWSRLQSAVASLRQALHTRPSRLLRVRETLAIGEKRQLLIVQCGEKQLLIGVAGNSLTMLAEVTALAQPEDRTA